MRVSLLFAACLVACGDGQTQPDASIDAPPIETDDAAVLPIRVEVVFGDGVTPAPGIDVVFHDAAGSPVGTAQTDAGGVATRTDAAVKMVTVVSLDSGNTAQANIPVRANHTMMGTRPGDVLQFWLDYGDGQPPPPPPPLLPTLDVTFPASPPAGTSYYWFDLMCEASGNGSTSFQYTLANDCTENGKLDILVIARGASNNDLAYSVMPGLTVATTGNTTVNFPGGWNTTFATLQQSFTNTPTGATTVRVNATFGLASGNRYALGGYQTSAGTPGGLVSRNYNYPDGFASSIRQSFDVEYGASPPRAYQFWQRTGPVVTTTTVDLAKNLLPQITSSSAAATNTVRPTIAWTLADNGLLQSADIAFTSIDWSSGGEDGYWLITFDPLTTSSIQIPALPDSLAAYRPPTDGTVGTTPRVSIQNRSHIRGYDVARQKEHPTEPDVFDHVQVFYPQ